MPTGNVIVTVVDVGQGQCTFVEIYNNSSPAKLIHTLLLDCGTDKPSTQTDVNLDYIAAKALELDKPGFDCIVFSHSDKDHIYLTRQVLDKIAETKKPVIKEVIYGGAYRKYTKYGFNILEHIEDEKYCSANKIFSLESNFTNYNYAPGKKKYEGNLWESANKDVVLYTIVGNVLSSDPDWDDNDLNVEGATAEALNRVSIIAGLYYAGASFVICGDATNITMAAVNSLFEGGTTVFANNKMTTMPHHGSRATGFAVKSGKAASDVSVEIVDTFAATLKSKTMSISAYEKHRHPSLELINKFIPTQITAILRDPRLKQKNTHRITAYIDVSLTTGKAFTILEGASYSFESGTNTFSTRYSDSGPYFSYSLGTKKASASEGIVATTPATSINPFACWRYTAASTGTAITEGYPNLAIPLAPFTSAPAAALSTTPDPEHEMAGTLALTPVELLPVFRIKVKDQSVKSRSAVAASSIPNTVTHYH